MEGYLGFREKDFERNVEQFYPVVVELLSRELSTEMRVALQNLLRRIGEVKLGVKPLPVVDVPFAMAKGRRRAGSIISGVSRRGSK